MALQEIVNKNVIVTVADHNLYALQTVELPAAESQQEQ